MPEFPIQIMYIYGVYVINKCYKHSLYVSVYIYTYVPAYLGYFYIALNCYAVGGHVGVFVVYGCVYICM